MQPTFSKNFVFSFLISGPDLMGHEDILEEVGPLNGVFEPLLSSGVVEQLNDT